MLIWKDNDPTDEFAPAVLEQVVYNDEGRGAFPLPSPSEGRRSDPVSLPHWTAMTISPPVQRALNRMELLRKEQEKQQTSLGAILQRNRFLIALALIGAALATWQFFRR